MKNAFCNIMKAIVSFVKAHTATAIVTASAVAVTAIAIPVGITVAKSNNFSFVPDKTVSAEEIEIIEETETIIIDNTVSSGNNSSVEDTTSVEEKPVVSEPVKEPVTSKEETPAPEKTPSQPQTTPSKPVPEEEAPSNPSTSVQVVQRADPETGISWDGVSPIIYTYPDGTTGTEKREGATYEGLPGMITTVVTVDYGQEMTPDKKPLTCTECGKELGDGTNGTCLMYWTGGGDKCLNCGEFVPEDTCHTCDK